MVQWYYKCITHMGGLINPRPGQYQAGFSNTCGSPKPRMRAPCQKKCITHRNLYIEINGVKLVITTGVGFPQEGVCSAKFWVIAYDDAVQILNEHRVFGQIFADDSIAMKRGKNLHQMMSRIQKVVDKLEEWGEQRGLNFNATKTVVVIFTKAD